MKENYCCKNLSDAHLIAEVKELVDQECKSLAELLSRLAEIDTRKLYARLGYSSLFAFMLAELHLSEDATYKRIQAARAARRFPVIFSLVAQGMINLTTINILSSILTEENYEDILKQSVYKTKRDVEYLKARYVPRADAPDMVRRLPPKRTCAGASSVVEKTCSQKSEDNPADARGNESAESESRSTQQINRELSSSPARQREPEACSGDAGGPARRDRVVPLTERRVKFQFTGDEGLRCKLERAKEVCRHKYPHGRLEDIIGEALEALLEKKDPERRLARKQVREERRTFSAGTKLGARTDASDARQLDCRSPKVGSMHKGAKPCKPKPPADVWEEAGSVSTRHIPQNVKDVVWRRDEGRCRYVSPEGKRCGERGGLEYDHIRPWALGGSSTDPGNVRLLCRLCRIRHKWHYADFRIMPTSNFFPLKSQENSLLNSA